LRCPPQSRNPLSSLPQPFCGRTFPFFKGVLFPTRRPFFCPFSSKPLKARVGSTFLQTLSFSIKLCPNLPYMKPVQNEALKRFLWRRLFENQFSSLEAICEKVSLACFSGVLFFFDSGPLVFQLSSLLRSTVNFLCLLPFPFFLLLLLVGRLFLHFPSRHRDYFSLNPPENASSPFFPLFNNMNCSLTIGLLGERFVVEHFRGFSFFVTALNLTLIYGYPAATSPPAFSYPFRYPPPDVPPFLSES